MVLSTFLSNIRKRILCTGFQDMSTGRIIVPQTWHFLTLIFVTHISRPNQQWLTTHISIFISLDVLLLQSISDPKQQNDFTISITRFCSCKLPCYTLYVAGMYLVFCVLTTNPMFSTVFWIRIKASIASFRVLPVITQPPFFVGSGCEIYYSGLFQML